MEEHGQNRPAVSHKELMNPHSLNVALRESYFTYQRPKFETFCFNKIKIQWQGKMNIPKRSFKQSSSALHQRSQKNTFIKNISRSKRSGLMFFNHHSLIPVSNDSFWRNKEFRDILSCVSSIAAVLNNFKGSTPKFPINFEPTNVYPRLLKKFLSASIRRCNSCLCCQNKDKMFNVMVKSLSVNYAETNFVLRNNKSSSKLSAELTQHVKVPIQLLNKDPIILVVLCSIYRMSILLDRSSTSRKSETIKDPRAQVTEHTSFVMGLQEELYKKNYCPEVLFSTSNTTSSMYLDGKLWLFPRSYLLMIYNKLCDFLSLYVFNHLSTNNPYRPEDTMKFIPFVSSLNDAAITMDQSFFKMSKSLEPLGTGLSLIEVDGVDNDGFLKSVINDLEEELKINIKEQKWYTILNNVNMEYRNELSTLTKIFGHPYVKMEQGSIKLHTNTTTEMEINMDAIRDVSRYAVKNFLKNYIIDHNEWPPLKEGTESLLSPIFQEARKMRRTPESLKHKYKEIPLSDYDNVILGKVMNFETYKNFLPYLKDKTISDLKEDFCKFLYETRNINGIYKSNIDTKAYYSRSSKITKRNTRLLFHYLVNSIKDLDHVGFTNHYTLRDWIIIINHFIIRIVPKEKELKDIFRGFGCQTFFNRARCLVQEMNVKSFLDKYCDEQAMTLGELEFKRKMRGLRNLQKVFKNHTMIYVNIDADKWNNRFRSLSVKDPCATVLDRIFDYPIFSKTQDYYENCFFYVPDNQQCYHWESQKGGIEGLNQDTWVFVYVNMIHMSMRSFNMPYFVLCKGDDLRVVIAVPPEIVKRENMNKLRLKIVQEIKEKCETVGQFIKIDDSYASQNYFCFNKIASVRNIELPQAFRKIQKVYGENNAMRRSLDLFISGCYSNGHSASAVSQSPFPAYCVSTFWTSFYLNTSQIYQDLNIDALAAFMLVPNLLGGFPVIYYHNFLVRGESDLLSSFLNIVQCCCVLDPVLHSYLIKFFDKSCFKEEITLSDFKGLVADAYCLPVTKPSSSESVLYQGIRDSLVKITKNEYIAPLLTDKAKETDREILEYFFETEIYDPRIMSAIYASSPGSMLTELVRKFETSKTIFDCIVDANSYQYGILLLKKAARVEHNLHLWRKEKMSKIGTDVIMPSCQMRSILDCPADIADRLRFIVWKKPVRSVTIAPSTHTVEIVYDIDTQANMTPRDMQNQFILDYSGKGYDSISERSTNEYFKTSGYDGYIGTRTNTGLIHQEASFIHNNMFLSKIKDLLNLYSWCELSKSPREEKNYTALITKILSFYLPQHDVNSLLPFKRNIRGGTVQHHVSSRGFKQEIIPNTLGNHFTFYKGNSDSNMTFKSRDQHFNINFLHIMATSIQILTFNHDCMRMLRNCEHRSISLIVKDCDYCHKEVEGGHLYSEKDVPNFETSSSILQSYFPEFTAEIIQRSQTMHNMSLSNRLSIYKVREFSKESATSIYVMENYYEASLSQFRAISSLQLSSSYNHDLSTIEDILGRVLHKLSGMTETKKADLKSMMEWMDKITITQFMDRSVVLNTTNLDHYSNSEYLHLLPYYCFLKRLNTIMRYDSFLKTFNSLYPYEKIPPGDLGVICRYLTSTAIRRIKFEHDLLLYYNSNSPLSSARNYFRIFLACRIMYIIYRNPFRNLTIDGPNFPSYYDYLSTRYFNTDMYTLNYLHFLIYMYFVLPDKLELLAAVTNQEMEYEQSVTLTIRDLLTNLDDIPSEYDKIDNMEPTSRFCFTMVKHHCSALRSVEFWTDPFDEELSEDFIQSINDLIELTIKTNTLTLTGYDLPDIINEIRRSSRPNPLKYIYLYPGPEKTPLNLNLQLYIPHQTITSTHLELDNSLLGLIPPKKPANKKLILSLWELYDTNKIFISPILNYIVCMLRKNNIPDISQAQVVIGNDNGGYLLSILWQFFINTSFIYFEETDHSQNEVILSMDPRLTSSDLISRRNNLFTETIQTGTSSLSNAISPSHLNKFFTFTQPDQLLFLFYPKTTISTLEHLETGLQKISGFLVSFLKTVAVMIVQVDHDDLNKFSTRLLPKLVSSSQNSDFLHPIYVCDKNIFTFVFLEFNPLLFQEQQITFLTIHSERIFSDRMERNLLSIEKITSLASFESECKYDDLEIIYLGRLIHYILPSLSDYYNIDLLPVNVRNLECLNYYNTIQDCFIAIRNFITGLLVSQLNQTSCVEYNIMKSKETIIPDSVEFTRHHSSSLHSDATWSSTTRKTLRDYYEKIVYLKSVIFGMNKHSLENTGYHDMEIENNNFYITLLSECNKNLFPNRRFLPIADAYQDEGFIFKPKSIMVSGVKNGLRIYYILELLYK